MTILRCKVSVVGEAKVGKTALCATGCGKQFPKNYAMTMGVDFAVKVVKQPKPSSVSVELYLFDTGGNEVYSKIRSKFWQKSNMILLCYNVMDPDSFKKCIRWIEEYSKSDIQLPVQGCLVALQSDLKDHSTVSEDTARGLAKKHALEFFSVSSLTGKNVDKPFEYLARQCAEQYAEALKVFSDE